MVKYGKLKYWSLLSPGQLCVAPWPCFWLCLGANAVSHADLQLQRCRSRSTFQLEISDLVRWQDKGGADKARMSSRRPLPPPPPPPPMPKVGILVWNGWIFWFTHFYGEFWTLRFLLMFWKLSWGCAKDQSHSCKGAGWWRKATISISWALTLRGTADEAGS